MVMENADRDLSSDGSFFSEGCQSGRVHTDLGKDLGRVLAHAGRGPATPVGT